MKNNTQTLQKNFVKYRDLLPIKVKGNKEPFVSIGTINIPYGYKPEMVDMIQFTGNDILVRKSVAKRLKKAQNILQKKDKKLSLYITYGYRNLSVQTKKFMEILSKITAKTFYEDPIDLYEKTHENIAVPTVAGHPTGGAVDIIIIDIKSNKSIDFGSNLYDFLSQKCYVFYPYITQKSKKNRMLLKKCMTKAGFAPYNAEWWHFSYGDKEWAFYYKKKYALYTQLNMAIEENLKK